MDIEAVRPKIMALMSGFEIQENLNIHPFNLSYGQKKRLNIASVLAYKPRLLLLDEIFIGQDEENINYSLKLLNDYVEKQQAAVILVNHYLDPLVKLADRLLFMDLGRLLFDSPMKQYRMQLKKNNKQDYLPQYC
jgi:polar amino acid transport system permease protein